MLEHHDAPEGREESGLYRAPREVPVDRPMADREVPLPSGASSEPADVATAVHQWLDGETSERVARYADAKQVELWNRISEETTRRSRMVTPAYVPERIMAALPQKTPPTVESFWTRSLALTPVSAALAAAGFVAVGIVIGRLILS